MWTGHRGGGVKKKHARVLEKKKKKKIQRSQIKPNHRGTFLRYISFVCKTLVYIYSYDVYIIPIRRAEQKSV